MQPKLFCGRYFSLIYICGSETFTDLTFSPQTLSKTYLIAAVKFITCTGYDTGYDASKNKALLKSANELRKRFTWEDRIHG